jgi:putative NIF3 family GTP cyclohydrolase 1 type 2
MENTIEDVVDIILKAVPSAPPENTVDTFKAGDPSQKVTGIVTTWLASYEVIQRANELGANLIITHEPTYYNHLDNVDWLEGDTVYQAKRQLIDENNIVIWRFHDLWDRHGIIPGLLRELGWEDYADRELNLYNIPPTSVKDLTISLKEKLGIRAAQVVGDLEMVCHCVALSPGFAGGRRQIELLGKDAVDVLICGEIHEWETCEYVRDAIAEGKHKALIVLGHVYSEEPGMKWLVEWLRPHLPGIAVTHVPTGDSFGFL